VREFLKGGEHNTELAARLDRGNDHDQHLRGPKFRGRDCVVVARDASEYVGGR